MEKAPDRQHIRDTILRSLSKASVDGPLNPEQPVEANDSETGHFDFDLAEFPLFRFHKNRSTDETIRPLEYRDKITGKDGQPVSREWLVYPGPFGFGGQSTQALLYDLVQLYIEQGCRGSQIQFGTLRSLFLRRGDRNPSARDYERMRRDIDILLGYAFHCKNAFWDARRRAYVDMKWRLFTAVFFFKDSPTPGAGELPFGFIEVSSTLQQIARVRGFFGLGFDHRFFHNMKPLEQRLAVYLAKKFTSQKTHRRFIDDLAQALPIEAERSDNQRAILQRAGDGLLGVGFPLLQRFSLEKSRDGRWLAVFERSAAPQQAYRLPTKISEELGQGITPLIDRITAAVGSDADRLWWSQCVRRLGAGAVDRALGQLKEAVQQNKVRSRGALLTKIFKDIATETRIALQ